MQLESLKVFCDVVRLQSFSKGATANELTQSAASQIVHMLEDRLNSQLIDRSTRPLRLTPVGQVYYEGCKRLLQEYYDLEDSIRCGRPQHVATVEVAAIYSVSMSDLGQLQNRFRVLYPHALVHVDYVHPDQVYEKVLEGKADLGLLSFPRKLRELVVKPWHEEPMVLACPPEHPLAASRTVKPAQLQGQKFIAFHHDLAIRRHIDRFLRKHGVKVEIECEFDTIENIKHAIIDGQTGIALLPEPTLRNEIRAGTLASCPLEGATLARPLGVIYRRHHELSNSTQKFLDLLLQGANGKASNSPLGQGHSSNGTPAGTPTGSRSRQRRS